MVMKEIIVRIPDTKLSFILELFKNLGIEVKGEEFVISKEHQDIVLDRIENTKEEDLLNWDDIKEDFDGI